MKYKLATAGVVAVALILSTLSVAGIGRQPADAAAAGAWNLKEYGPRSTDNVILKWDEQLLSVIRAYPPQTGPTITSRALGVLHTATYDAWAAYDPIAKGTRPDGPRQQASNTEANKKEAISYAAYRVLEDLFPASRFPAKTAPPVDYSPPANLLISQGFDPGNTTLVPNTPAGVGNLAAKAVLDFRHHDGSNQLGDEPARTTPNPARAYADYTGYLPRNQWNQVNDRWRWQPLCVLTPVGVAAGKSTKPADGTCVGPNYAIQNPLGPHWPKVIPFAASAAQYKVTGPPKNPDGSFSTADIATALADTSNLDDVKKVKAEYWADGPNTEFPPGHTAVFAQAMSRRNGNSLDTDAKLFFTVGNALMDAGIASWVQKYKYDFVRPVTAIREEFKRPQHNGKQINSWLGPNKGFGNVDPDNWMPYQALNVVTPPFPEYVSGHSTFTAAGNVVLMSYFGDTFGASVTVPARTMRIESSAPSVDVTLTWPTFTAAADEAGMSRRYGGIHFSSGDMHGRMLGNLTGRGALGRANAYIQGTIGT